jgi:hypothetical protein
MNHERFEACIAACDACAAACDHCAASCLREQDVTPMARCIRLDIDCAALCRLASAMMTRGSELAADICAACAAACEACADECEQHGHEHCQACAAACRACAEACELMAVPVLQEPSAGLHRGAY